MKTYILLSIIQAWNILCKCNPEVPGCRQHPKQSTKEQSEAWSAFPCWFTGLVILWQEVRQKTDWRLIKNNKQQLAGPFTLAWPYWALRTPAWREFYAMTLGMANLQHTCYWAGRRRDYHQPARSPHGKTHSSFHAEATFHSTSFRAFLCARY